MKITILLSLLITMNSYSKEEYTVIKLGYIQASDRIDQYTNEFLANVNKILKPEKFKVKAIPLPSVRDLHLANKGDIHGSLSRSNLVDNSSFANLKMVKTPIAQMKYVISKKTSKNISDEDKDLKLVCIRDDRLCNGMLGKGFKIYEVNSHKAQVSMLKTSRVDFLMRVFITATGLNKELIVPKLDGIEVEAYKEPFTVYTYTYVNYKKFPKIYKALSSAYAKLAKKK